MTLDREGALANSRCGCELYNRELEVATNFLDGTCVSSLRNRCPLSESVTAAASLTKNFSQPKSERGRQPLGRHPRSSPITVLTPAIGEQQDSPAARLPSIINETWARCNQP